MAANLDLQTDHKEAVRLSRAHWRVPATVIFVSLLVLSSVVSATSTMWSFGPVTPIP